jgi:plasmid stabilization system protein ParE
MASLSLRFARRAERQLGDILDYIALDNPDAASKVAVHVETLLEKLLSFPELGPQVFPNLPHREVKAYPCRLIYRQREQVLWVVAVLRVEQLLRPEMLGRD